jgi:hypothetical protein
MIFAANTTFSALCFSDTCDVAVAALHNLVEPFGVARQQGVRAIKIAPFRRENRLLTSGSISGVPAFDTFSYPRKKQVSSLQSPCDTLLLSFPSHSKLHPYLFSCN